MRTRNHIRASLATIVLLLTLQWICTAGAQTVTLENPHVALNVDTTLGAITSIHDKELDITYQITGVSFALASDRGNVQALTPTSNTLVGDTLTFTFSTSDFDIDLHYQLGGDNRFVEKWFELTTKDGQPCEIGTVTLEDGTLGPQFEQIHFHDDNTIWQCPINLFLRGENGGCFAGISYPYWEMDLDGNTGFTLGFAPNYTLPAAETFVSEKYFLGVYRREGIHRYSQGPYPGAVPNPYVGWGGKAGITQHFKSGVVPAQAVPSEILDWGEVWAMQKFMEHVLPDDLPLPEPGFWIWQNGWWAGLFSPDNAILDQLKLAGVHDIMTANTWYGRGTHPLTPPYIAGTRVDPLGFPKDGVPGDYTTDFIAASGFDAFHQYGQSIGVHVSSFSLPCFLFDQKPEWASIDANGNISEYLFGRKVSCPAVDDYMDHMLEILDNVFTKYNPRWWGFDGRWLSYWEVPYYRPGPDGLGFDTCHATDHGHEPGDNLYKEWKNIQNLLKELRSRHPGVCLEQYLGLKRGGPWAMRYLNADDNYYETNGATLNRFQTWHNQNDRFRPVYKNYAAIFGGSPAEFRNSVLTSISTTSYCQLGPGYKDLALQENRDFLAQWRAWATANYDYLKVKRDLFDCPGFKRLDGSAHIIGDSGFLFLFPSGSGATPRSVIPLTRWIELDEDPAALYRITELYPQAGRVIGTYQYGDDFPYDMSAGTPVVLSIEPAPPGAVPEQTVPLLAPGQVVTINAFTSFGDPVTNAVGMTQANAEAAIVADGYAVGVITTAYSETVAAGHVISQNPTPGTLLTAGSSVDLVVSLGNVRVTVPDVVGQDQAAAESDVVAANLTPTVTLSFSETIPAGEVMSQNPAAGADVLAGSQVEIVVSRGEVGEVQYWRLDDGSGATAANAITGGNPGTLVGPPTWITTGLPPNLPSTAALDFDPGDHLDCGNINLSSTSAGGEVTVSMWLKPDTLTGDVRLIGQLSGATSQAGVVGVGQTAGVGGLWVWDGTGFGHLTSAGALSAGAWQHLALVWDSGQVTAYLDGVAQMTAIADFDFGAGNGNFGIAAKFLGQYGIGFDGQIDDVSIFDAALSAQQVLELYQQSPQPFISTLNPADNATGVTVDSNLVVTFDRDVAFGSGNITLRASAGGTVVESFDVTSSPRLLLSGPTVTIDPINDLADASGYYVQIDATAIKDASDNFFAGIADTTTWNFHTGTPDYPPAISSIDSPANGATGVPVNASLVLTFDEDVQIGTRNVVIRRLDDNSLLDTIDVTAGNVTIHGAQVTIAPNVTFPYLTGLYVEIVPGAFTDLADNPFPGINGSGTWSFTTAAASSATAVITTADGNGADAYVHKGANGNNNYGGGTNLWAQDFSGTSSVAVYIRFDLSGYVSGSFTSATLSLTSNEQATVPLGSAAGRDFRIHGLLDGQAGNNWGEGTITYNNAPGLTIGSGVASADIDPAKTVLLANTLVQVGNGLMVDLSNPALLSFLNNDTDGLVTFIVSGPVTGASVAFDWAAKEHATLAAPTLNVQVGGSSITFTDWQVANSTTGDSDDDHDGDGVMNGIEYFLGGANATTGFTPLPGVSDDSGTLSVTWVKSADYPGTYGTDFRVETSGSLTGTWMQESPGTNVTVTGNDVKYTFPAPLGARKFARLVVTGP